MAKLRAALDQDGAVERVAADDAGGEGRRLPRLDGEPAGIDANGVEVALDEAAALVVPDRGGQRDLRAEAAERHGGVRRGAAGGRDLLVDRGETAGLRIVGDGDQPIPVSDPEAIDARRAVEGHDGNVRASRPAGVSWVICRSRGASSTPPMPSHVTGANNHPTVSCFEFVRAGQPTRSRWRRKRMNPDERRPLPGMTGVTVQRDVPARMRDGVALFADVYRPAGDGPFPVILMRLPYDKTQAENIAYSHPSWYARHGYMVVVQDVRGCCVSEGGFTPFEHEAEDGYDTIEWAARLPDANGRVGMYGFSYAGATQLMPATLRPPSLVTICPALTASQYYEGWTYNQGALALAFTMSWATDLATREARKAGDDAAVAQLAAAYAGMPGLNWWLPLAQLRTRLRAITEPISRTGSRTRPTTTTGDAGASTRTTGGSPCRRCMSAAGTTSSSRGPSRTSPACGTAPGPRRRGRARSSSSGRGRTCRGRRRARVSRGSNRRSSMTCNCAGSTSFSRAKRPACSTPRSPSS